MNDTDGTDSQPAPSTASRPVAFVTGASRGIGALAVRELVAAGFHVAAVARGREALDTLAAAFEPGRVLPIAGDIVDTTAMRGAVTRVLDTWGAIDVLVNNAGYGLRGAIEDIPAEELQRLFQVNVFAQIELTRLVLPAMRARGAGTVLYVSSVQGRVVVPFSGAYGASKFAIEAFADALRKEVRPFGVHVVLLEPGPVATEFAQHAKALSDDILRNPESVYGDAYASYLRAKKRINRGAVAPEKVARLIARIASARRPKARYRIQLWAWLLPVLAAIVPTRVADWLLMRPYRHAFQKWKRRAED